MMLAQTQHNGNPGYVSGVDRLFLAPEINHLIKKEPKSDVWSIGVILYLLITGGVTDKRHEEFFDFKEQVWFNVSEELKEFMMKLVAVDPKHRATLEELLQMDFIKLSRRHEDGLDITPLEDTNLNELRCNLYKFNMAHCFDEIIWRYRLNKQKRKTIRLLKPLFEAKSTVKDAVN